ncbi:MAG: NUDIX domain-containing protein [Oscillochloridaceae bacterium]|nr:NUDIX domain-containing protein [Chloroflexaceae bacterium]MDW8390690.1 NUDIX domain-containing protein [Oscillochloridaceae bacterium]
MSQKPVRAAGAVVYTRGNDGILLVLLIKDRYGEWTLPKGHVEPDEAEEAAAVREIAEETGIACTIEGPLARVSYPILKHGAWRDKEVTYFLARADRATPVPATAEGISEARWAAPAEALATISYSQIRDVTRQALAALGERV